MVIRASYHSMEDVLDQTRPISYDLPLFKEKCNTVYNFIYERTYRGLPLIEGYLF